MGVCQSSEDMEIKGYAYPCVTKMPQADGPPNRFPDEFSGSSSYVFHSSQSQFSFTATPQISIEKNPPSITDSYTQTWNKDYTARFPSTSNAVGNLEDSASVMDKPTIVALTFSGLLLVFVLLILVVLIIRRKRRNKYIDNPRVFHVNDLPQGCYSTLLLNDTGNNDHVQKSNNGNIPNGKTNVDGYVYDAVNPDHEISQQGGRSFENVTYSECGVRVTFSGNTGETQEGYLIPDRVLPTIIIT